MLMVSCAWRRWLLVLLLCAGSDHDAAACCHNACGPAARICCRTTTLMSLGCSNLPKPRNRLHRTRLTLFNPEQTRCLKLDATINKRLLVKSNQLHSLAQNSCTRVFTKGYEIMFIF
jgi:hypothetical protein